jgi:hypothetical protein
MVMDNRDSCEVRGFDRLQGVVQRPQVIHRDRTRGDTDLLVLGIGIQQGQQHRNIVRLANSFRAIGFGHPGQQRHERIARKPTLDRIGPEALLLIFLGESGWLAQAVGQRPFGLCRIRPVEHTLKPVAPRLHHSHTGLVNVMIAGDHDEFRIRFTGQLPQLPLRGE